MQLDFRLIAVCSCLYHTLRGTIPRAPTLDLYSTQLETAIEPPLPDVNIEVRSPLEEPYESTNSQILHILLLLSNTCVLWDLCNLSTRWLDTILDWAFNAISCVLVGELRKFYTLFTSTADENCLRQSYGEWIPANALAFCWTGAPEHTFFYQLSVQTEFSHYNDFNNL